MREDRSSGEHGLHEGRGPLRTAQPLHSHVSFVVLPDFLDTHVILGVNEGLGSGVRLGQCHDARDVLEVVLVVHFDLQEWGGDQDLIRTRRQWAAGVPWGGGMHVNDTGEPNT